MNMNITLPSYLSHLKVVENTITIDSAVDKALLSEYLRQEKAKFTVEQTTVSRCVYHIKRIGK